MASNLIRNVLVAGLTESLQRLDEKYYRLRFLYIQLVNQGLTSAAMNVLNTAITIEQERTRIEVKLRTISEERFKDF